MVQIPFVSELCIGIAIPFAIITIQELRKKLPERKYYLWKTGSTFSALTKADYLQEQQNRPHQTLFTAFNDDFL